MSPVADGLRNFTGVPATITCQARHPQGNTWQLLQLHNMAATVLSGQHLLEHTG